MLLKSENCEHQVLDVDAVGAVGADDVQLRALAVDHDVLRLTARALDLDVALGVADPVAVRVAEDRDQVLRVRALAVLLVGERVLPVLGALVDVLAAGRRRAAARQLLVDARHHEDAGAVLGVVRPRPGCVVRAVASAGAGARARSLPWNVLMRCLVVAVADHQLRARGRGSRETPPDPGPGRTSRARRARRPSPAGVAVSAAASAASASAIRALRNAKNDLQNPPAYPPVCRRLPKPRSATPHRRRRARSYPADGGPASLYLTGVSFAHRA